jgi:hypothetical protein
VSECVCVHEGASVSSVSSASPLLGVCFVLFSVRELQEQTTTTLTRMTFSSWFVGQTGEALRLSKSERFSLVSQLLFTVAIVWLFVLFCVLLCVVVNEIGTDFGTNMCLVEWELMDFD